MVVTADCLIVLDSDKLYTACLKTTTKKQFDQWMTFGNIFLKDPVMGKFNF